MNTGLSIPRPWTINEMWGAWKAPSASGTRPGLTVSNLVLPGLEIGYRPPEAGETVVQGQFAVSSGWRYLPTELACQISRRASSIGLRSPSSTLPWMTIRSWVARCRPGHSRLP